MIILINCSNLKIGGGLQVAHSFLDEIKTNENHIFHIVLSSNLKGQISPQEYGANFKFYFYDIRPSILKILHGQDAFLDRIVEENHVDTVFSVFGPAYWKPSVKHVVGFAKPHYIYTESPFFQIITKSEKYKLWLKGKFQLLDFSLNNVALISENEDVSLKLRKMFKGKKIFTVTNYYNQVFDFPDRWDRDIILPEFKGYTLLNISANYPHKNLLIIPKVVEFLHQNYPLFSFRFVLTVEDDVFKHIVDSSIKSRILCIGKVNIDQCPNLYEKSDAVFLPTLLECFTATYPEAMRMEKPILTSNLDFAKGLCQESACYFDPLDPKDIGEKIFDLSQDENKKKQLVKAGSLQLKQFDNYRDRATKYLELITS